MTAAELQDRRGEVRAELGEERSHLLAVLRKPDPALRTAPIGDVLCWCDGLDEAKVSRILAASEIPWGRGLSKLTRRDTQMLCLQIKARHPETWERWRESVRGR